MLKWNYAPAYGRKGRAQTSFICSNNSIAFLGMRPCSFVHVDLRESDEKSDTVWEKGEPTGPTATPTPLY